MNSIQEINDRLQKLYETNKSNFNKIIQENTNSDSLLAGPLLMKCDDSYMNNFTKFKILFIGQEAGWEISKETMIENLLNKYSSYLDEKVNKIGGSSPFWQYALKINKILNPGNANKKCFLWTNLCKFSDDSKPLSESDYLKEIEHIKILLDEIKIIQPDLIIFFTGPNYDSKIRDQFGQKVIFTQILDDVAERELAYVQHESLYPSRIVIRTYHPGYLKRSSKFQYLDFITELALMPNIPNRINTFKEEIIKLQTEFDLKVKFFAAPLGMEDSGFYFYNESWKNKIGIGFGFDESWAKDFFNGIYVIDENDGGLRQLIANKFQFSKGSQNFPYWSYSNVHKNWCEKTYSAIEDGSFTEHIKSIINKLLNELKDKDLI
ncbi:MAG: hypothetical protein IPJ66_13705 [Bacteroidetes bacterium]|nr:hypothetical protein [Bacteroidota bacterium]MBL0065514.1 hypothetical protein [Bacteroidota bacterium]